MHEFALMTHLLDAVESHARELEATRVVTINLAVGSRTGVVEDSFAFYFDMLTPGTVAEGAELNMHHTSMRFHCPACHQDYTPVQADFDCPGCHAVGQLTDDGSQLLIESLEIET
ncbi:MAG: hydrogenase maturation nickel metallochaperone HypA [Thermomicrobiales bacterium]